MSIQVVHGAILSFLPFPNKFDPRDNTERLSLHAATQQVLREVTGIDDATSQLSEEEVELDRGHVKNRSLFLRLLGKGLITLADDVLSPGTGTFLLLVRQGDEPARRLAEVVAREIVMLAVDRGVSVLSGSVQVKTIVW